MIFCENIEILTFEIKYSFIVLVVNILISNYFIGIKKIISEHYTTSNQQYPKLPPTDYIPIPYKVKYQLHSKISSRTFYNKNAYLLTVLIQSTDLGDYTHHFELIDFIQFIDKSFLKVLHVS